MVTTPVDFVMCLAYTFEVHLYTTKINLIRVKGHGYNIS